MCFSVMSRLNTQLCLSGNITGNVSHTLVSTLSAENVFTVYSGPHIFEQFPYTLLFTNYTFLLSGRRLLHDGLLSRGTYLGIFEAEMTHVMIDQAEGKAPVHESQAPLQREEAWLAGMQLRCVH